MNLHELLGVDPHDPEQQLSDRLVRADESLLDELINIRRSRGLSQADVGRRMGVGQSAVARIEGGERDPHLSTLRRYALAIGADIRHVVTRADTMSRYERRNQLLVEATNVGSDWDESVDWTKGHIGSRGLRAALLAGAR